MLPVKIVHEMVYYVSSGGTLKLTHSLTHSLPENCEAQPIRCTHTSVISINGNWNRNGNYLFPFKEI